MSPGRAREQTTFLSPRVTVVVQRVWSSLMEYIRVSEETAVQVSFVTSFGGWGSESSNKAFHGTCTVSFVRLPEWQKKKIPHCPSRPRGTRTSSPRLMNVAGA